MKYIDLGELKNKFGLLLMRLHRDAKISASIINQKMLFAPFFDFFERNNVDELVAAVKERLDESDEIDTIVIASATTLL